MRFKQFILEAMNVSGMGRDFRRHISKELPKLIISHYRREYRAMPFYAYAYDQNIRTPDPKPGYLLIKEWIELWLGQQMADFARKSIQQASGRNADTPWEHIRRVKFVDYSKDDPNHGHNGTWHQFDRYISINMKYLDELVKLIYDELCSHFIDTGFEIATRAEDLDLSRAVDILNEIADVLVHEVTHAHQWDRSENPFISKSYLVNKKKYEKIMAQARGTFGRHRIYLSAPIEIEAFAQDTAHELLRSIDWEDEVDFDYLISNIEYLMKGTLSYNTQYAQFATSKDPREYKMFKRFVKKVYQELDARREEVRKMKKEVEQKMKDEEDAKKKQQAYDDMIDDWLKDEGILDSDGNVI